jgi:hypothetical protein
MICGICEQVSLVPTGTRIPTAFTNNLWDRKLNSGRRVSLICRRRAARVLVHVEPEEELIDKVPNAGNETPR